MIFPVGLISACLLISASLGSEESCYLSEEQEDPCASVCYPIVKPLLRYFEKTHEKDAQLSKCQIDLQRVDREKYAEISKCQQDNSDLVRRYSEVLNHLMDEKEKDAQLQLKHLEVDNLKTVCFRRSLIINISQLIG